MRTVDLKDMPYRGSTSRPGADLLVHDPNCTRCGSSLRGRYQGAEMDKARRAVVHLWECRCGRKRHVLRAVAT